MTDEPLLQLRSSVLGGNNWKPATISFFEDRIDEVVAPQGLGGLAGRRNKYSLRYEQVANVVFEKGLVWSGLVIESTGGHVIAIKGLKKEEAEEAKRLVEELQARARDGQREAATSQVPVSVADELAKLAALRDSGALTDEEFAEAKRRILAG